MSSEESFLAPFKFFRRALRPDDFQKFVLPGLMTLILLLGIFSTFDLQDSYGSESLNVTLESTTEKQILEVKNNYFSDRMDQPLEKALKEVENERTMRINELRSKPLFKPKGLLSRMVFESGAFFVVPDKHGLAPWNPEEEYVRAEGLVRYRTDSISSLGVGTEGSYSYSEFQSDLEEIKSKEIGDGEVQSFLNNSEEGAQAKLSSMGEASLTEIQADGVDNLGIIDFIPAVLLNFILYYLIGAISVEGNRELVNKVFGDDSEEI